MKIYEMHKPVLLKEVLRYLDPKPRENFIDCTIGFGGHALAILEKNKPDGKVLGIEQSKETLDQLKQKAGSDRIILAQGNFADLKKIIRKNIEISKFQDFKFHGVLLDLGLSSWQIEKSGRGFSFLRDEPLDMRFNSENSEQRTKNSDLTAEKIVNEWPKENLEKIFKEYGGERYAKQIAEKICQKRQGKKINTTKQLVEVIRQAAPQKYFYGRIHFATRVFQALRITVNDELNNLSKALPQAVEILESGGRLAVISFHSLEDQIVKNFFRQLAKENKLKILTKKPIRPGQEEISQNPRSRSAKLRVAEKLEFRSLAF